MTKRVSLSLDKEQIKILESFIKNFDNKNSKKVKNILFTYLSEKGYIDG